MKPGIFASILLIVGVPVSQVHSQETSSTESDAISSLEEITRQVDEAPALLFLTPSQINAPESKKNMMQQNKNGLTHDGGSGRRIQEMKALQATINQLKIKKAAQDRILQQQRKEEKKSQFYQDKIMSSENEIKKVNVENEQLKKTIFEMENHQGETDLKVKRELSLSRQETANLKEKISVMVKEDNKKQLIITQLEKNIISNNVNDKKNNEKINILNTENAQKKDENEKLKKENALLTRELLSTSPKELEMKSDIIRRDYAIGVSIGNDIIKMFDEKKSQGVSVDPAISLTGITDTIKGHVKLSSEEIAKALYESEMELNKKIDIVNKTNKRDGVKFVSSFKKEKGVLRDQLGFYYRIDYAGKTKFSDDDIVTIVVKESLINGTVIKDMELAGTSISQPLNAYPPIFKQALSKLNNHGSITLVIPPELAYGEKGLPPEIPPGATIIYNVRIIDVEDLNK